MCTVSYYNSGDRIIITANRDEHIGRSEVIWLGDSTEIYPGLIFPQETKAGGTWFVWSKLGKLLVLMNGGDKPHEKAAFYRKSRGLILLDLASEADSLVAWERIDLAQIEPFSLVYYSFGNLYRMVWDGSQKRSDKLNGNGSYIWSSSTLYSDLIKQRRREWFEAFLVGLGKGNEAERIMQFHSSCAANDKENGLVISRDNGICTRSISQIEISIDKVFIRHKHLLKEGDYMYKQEILNQNM